MPTTNLYFKTAGDGYWSNRQTEVNILNIDIPYIDSTEGTFGELVVTFDVDDWNIDTDGLIYTDSQFLADLRQHLINEGFSKEAVMALDYSEQGMQGEDYVSLDAGEEFLRQWRIFKEIYSPYIGA